MQHEIRRISLLFSMTRSLIRSNLEIRGIIVTAWNLGNLIASAKLGGGGWNNPGQSPLSLQVTPASPQRFNIL